jgi:hypothetical protein
LGERRTQLLRAAKADGTTPEKLVNRLLAEAFTVQDDGPQKKHELSLFKSDGVAICFTEAPRRQRFRFNEHEDNDAGRFQKAIAGIIGKSLTFAKLTGKEEGGELLPI